MSLKQPVHTEAFKTCCYTATALSGAMMGENRQLVTNWLSLRNKQLKLKTAGKLPSILEEFIEYTPI